MNVICLEEPAFYELVETVVKRLKGENTEEATYKDWVNTEAAMSLLNIKSRTTLQKLRDEGKIRFSQPTPKNILYQRASLENYLENNAQNTF
jgi:hypothetical protein